MKKTGAVYTSTPNSGFTLIELATVVGIISLLIGGVLVGKNMVRSSQLQASVAHVQEFNSAIIKFRTMYYALPGDMPNATDMWGAAASGSNACTDPEGAGSGEGDDSTEGDDTETCNGNGDGRIGHTDLGSTSACDGGFWETFRLWEHLRNAELIEGDFTGIAGSAGDKHSVPGENVPQAPLYPGGYSIVHCGEIDSGVTDNAMFDGSYKHVVMIGGFRPSDNEFTWFPLFTTEEAAAVDEKFDDGRPGTGIVRAPLSDHLNSYGDNTLTNCTDESNAANTSIADYDFDYTGKRCPLYFTLGL